MILVVHVLSCMHLVVHVLKTTQIIQRTHKGKNVH